MLFKSKRGKAPDASAAAAFIAIIAALIVLYILVLPPEEREEILGEDGEVDEAVEEEKAILLSVSPKRISPPEEKEFEQDLPTVNIQVGEEGVELKRIDSLYIKRSLFTSKDYGINFNIGNLRDIRRALLNFYVEEGKGRLVILLNDQEIFNREIEKGNIAPIEIKEKLVEGINSIEFKASSPGAIFWRTNEYSLDNILITSDVLRKEAQESTLTFVVSGEEKANLERVKLRFLPECDELKSGALSIELNNFLLYSAVPDCGVPNRAIEFVPDRLVAGENRLVFKTTKGWYLVDEIKMTSELREAIAPIYYFELEANEYQDVIDEDANVTFYMRFADDVTRKVADITINNHLLRLDQTEVEYNETIDDWVTRGNNAIKIEPDEVLDIVELKVKLES